MNFGNPIWLYCTPAVLLVVGGLVAFGLRRRDHLLARFAAARLLDDLTEKPGRLRSAAKIACILLGLLGVGLALARPQYGVEFAERKARGLDIVFALDSSRSMLASDLRPSRLERAKLAILDLIERLESDRVGLVAFAGRAFLQCPPTLDYTAFRESLEATGPESITRGGSDIGAALAEAAKAFPAGNNVKVVVLLTDGEDLGGNALEAARAAAAAGITVHAIGIGTPEGEYLRIPGPQGGEDYVRDPDGQPVRTQLDESTLQQIAQTTGGRYSRLDNGSLEALYESVLSALPREERDSEIREVPLERYQWLLGAGLAFLVLEMLIRRRRVQAIPLAVVLALSSFFVPGESIAQAPVPMAPRNLDPASEAGTAADPGDAPAEAADPRELYNEGTDLIRSGDYEGARRHLEAAVRQSGDLQLQRDALYNMAHAVNQLGEQALKAQDPQAAATRWQEAEALFAAAREIDPTDEAAINAAEKVRARREALEEFLKQQKPPEQQNQQGSDENQESGEDQQQQDQKGEQGQNQQGSQGQDQQQDQQSGSSQQEQSGDQGDQQQDNPQEQEPADQGQEEQQSEGQEQAQSPEKSGAGDQSSENATQNEAPSTEQDDNGKSGSQGEQGDDDLEQVPLPSGEEGKQDMAESEAPAPGTTPESAADEAAGTATGNAAIEGMSQEEASALLNALRGSEQLLPFADQNNEASGDRTGRLRDW